MNKVIMIGNLANDPEGRVTQSGISQSTFRIAVQRRFANQQGVREADFFTVIAWRQTADFCNRYLSKGRRVAVEGSIQNRSYDAQDGSKRYVTEIIADSVEALGSRNEEGGQPRNYDNGFAPPPTRRAQPAAPSANDPAGADDGFAPSPAKRAQPAPPSANDFTEVEDDELPF